MRNRISIFQWNLTENATTTKLKTKEKEREKKKYAIQAKTKEKEISGRMDSNSIRTKV